MFSSRYISPEPELTLTDASQQTILNKLNLYLTAQNNTLKAQLKKRFHKNWRCRLRKTKRQLLDTVGMCHGLTLLWLYKMSENKEDWFLNMVNKIIQFKDEEVLEHEMDFEKFIALIEWCQDPAKYTFNNNPPIDQRNPDRILEIEGNVKVVFEGKLQEIIDYLEPIIRKNKMLCVIGSGAVEAHSIGIFSRNGEYYFYNPNEMAGVFQFNHLSWIGEYLHRAFYSACNLKNEAKIILEIYIMSNPHSLESTIPKKRKSICSFFCPRTNDYESDIESGPVHANPKLN